MRKPAVIIIDPDGHRFLGKEELNIETGEVSFFEIAHYLKQAQLHFHAVIHKQAVKHVGTDKKLVADWIQENLDKYIDK